MREPVRDKGRLEHMLLAISNVEEFTTPSHCYSKLIERVSCES